MYAELGNFVVRSINPWEGARVFRLTGDPKVTRYLGFRTHETQEQAEALLEMYNGDPRIKWFAVCRKETPQDIIGIVGFEVNRHSATLTLMFRSDWKARGAGVQFADKFVAWILAHPQIWRVWSYVHVDNLLGQRAIERTGAKKEGCLRRFEIFPNISNEPQDVFVYGIVRDDL